MAIRTGTKLKSDDFRDRPFSEITRGERNVRWIETFCLVPEGKLRGRNVQLRPWQVDIIRDIYDSPTSTYIVSFGRKNGKTALIAFLVLLHLCGPEAEIGSEIVSGARSRDQAALVFRYASKCVRMNESLSNIVKVRDSLKELYCSELQTIYKALSADAKTNLGRSPKLVVHDELGQVKGPHDEFYEAIETSQGAHDDPLNIIISTQAPRDGDLLSIMIDDALAGHDPKLKVTLYTADRDLDPFSEDAVAAANPAYGDFLNAEVTLKQAEKARRMPSKEADFRNLILNQRVNLNNPFVTRSVWELNSGEPDFRHVYDVFIGIDLSARNDLTSIVAVGRDVQGIFHVRPLFFAPAVGLEDRAQRDREPYDVWARDGFLELTPGPTVDYSQVATVLCDLCDEFRVTSIPFDRWRIDLLKLELQRINIELPLVPFGQGFKDMTPALDTLESLLLEGRVRHGDHPILTMCAENSVAVSDAAGSKKLDKAKSTGRIDGMVALAMAIGAANTHPLDTTKPFKVFTLG